MLNKITEKIRLQLRSDPMLGVREILGVTVDPFQQEFIEEVWKSRRLHVMTANEIGKTFTLSCVVLIWLYAFGPNCTVICTASTGRQVYGQLWAEIKDRYHSARFDLGGDLLETKLTISDKCFMQAFSTSNEANFEGWHNENLLVVFDEAKGIRPDIYKGAERLLRGKGGKKHWVVAGTPPLAPIGEFCQIKLDSARSKRWKFMHISGWDSDRVSDEECQHTLDEWGEDSPFYQSMVLGQIPTQGEDTLIASIDVEKAVERDIEATGDVTVACDVARFGTSETVIYAVQHGKIIKQIIYRGKDIVFTAGKMKEAESATGANLLRVDDSGVGGGVTDILMVDPTLRQLKVEIEPMNFGAKAIEDETGEIPAFADLATQMWWHAGKLFAAGKVSIPDDSELKAQLVSRRYGYATRSGQVVMKLESKEIMRNKGRKSPDRADALVMALWRREIAIDNTYYEEDDYYSPPIGQPGDGEIGDYTEDDYYA